MEKLLVFHLKETEVPKLRQITANMKIRCEFVDDSDYRQTIDALVRGHKDPIVAPYSDKVPPESLLLLCDFTDKRMDKLLAALRHAEVQVDYKAALTPTNRQWNVLRLLFEMERERKIIEKEKKGT